MRDLQYNQPKDCYARQKKDQPIFPEGKEYMAGQGSCRRHQRAYQIHVIKLFELG
jgi:hypothetical protein